jgi:micrococcal nuclease
MNSSKKILIVLSCAVVTSLIIFSVLRVIALTGRVEQLENILNSQQESPLPQSTSLVQERVAPPDGSQHKVLNVVDGDTITIETVEGSLPVRIIGIDTPETVHPFKPVEPGGQEASMRAKELLEGQIVTIHYDPDPQHGKWGTYERLLVYLDMPDGRDFGIVMIQEGFARAYPKYPFSRQEAYLDAEQIAQQNKLGVWAEEIEPELSIEGNS